MFELNLSNQAELSMLRKIEGKLEGSSWEVVRNRLMVLRFVKQCRVVDRFMNQGDALLDLGCGIGQNGVILNEMGYEVLGLEVKKFDYWKKLGGSAVVYNGEEMPFKDGVFDGVLMSGVLEHIGPNTKESDDRNVWKNQLARLKLLTNVRRMLKLDGKVFVYNFPNKTSPVELFNELLDLPVRHRGSEKQSLSSLLGLVESAGFKIVRAGRTGVMPASVGFVLPQLRNRLVNPLAYSLNRIDEWLDTKFGNRLGQSNYVIARKI